jgi:hypothetical protein
MSYMGVDPLTAGSRVSHNVRKSDVGADAEVAGNSLMPLHRLAINTNSIRFCKKKLH